MSDGEIHDIKWPVYSKHVDKVFCFFYTVFSSSNYKSALGMVGLAVGNMAMRNWKTMKLVSIILPT